MLSTRYNRTQPHLYTSASHIHILSVSRQMTSEQPWSPLPRPPTLDIHAKFDSSSSSSLISDLSASSNAGALTPDILVTSRSLFEHPLSSPIQAPSALIIGSYLLADKSADMPNGLAVYQAVHVGTNERFVCRAVPLDRCHLMLMPYAVVGPHPNIDGVKEIVMGSTCAYAMHGTLTTCSEDLHAYVRRRRRLSEPEAARLFAQVLEAVAHCHRHGVVVRDIKLRRFLFADDDRAWLKLDGLYDAAIFNGCDDQLTDKHGCLAYVSPEILDATFCGGASASAAASGVTPAPPGTSYSGRAADMWSLGVVLYTMLVGRYPFADSDACALFSRIRRGRYPMPNDVPLSPTARCLIRSLLTVKPDERLTAEEAIRHPWFASVEADDQVSTAHASPSSSQTVDDGVVPQCDMEIADDFAVD